jgi:RHS repeat-associated protein
VRRKNGQGFCCEDAPQNAPARAPSANDNPELFQYYYHSDHLGSTSLITDLDGNVVQHVEYVPFGEVFIEERNNKWNTPYLFNAKELDEETGLYYYGARYYEPRVSVWYGADPMQEKYPGVSSYAYALQNPVRFVYPDGKNPGDVFATKNAAARDFGKLYNDNSIRNNREYGATIYKVIASDGKVGYTYSIPNKGSSNSSVMPSQAPEGTTAVAYVHSHAAYSFGTYNDNKFSGTAAGATSGDIPYAKYYNIDGYVATPNGSLQRYDINTGKIIQVSSQMPSDANDPSRKNKISSAPTTTTYIVKKGDSLISIAKIFDTSAAAIIKENNLKTNIKIGQKLEVTN